MLIASHHQPRPCIKCGAPALKSIRVGRLCERHMAEVVNAARNAPLFKLVTGGPAAPCTDTSPPATAAPEE